MQTRSSILSKVTLLCFLALWLARSNACAADAKADPTAGYASSGAIQNGNHITLNTRTGIFTETSERRGQPGGGQMRAGGLRTNLHSQHPESGLRVLSQCPGSSKHRRRRQSGERRTLRRLIVCDNPDDGASVDAAQIEKWYFHANGVVFGALESRSNSGWGVRANW